MKDLKYFTYKLGEMQLENNIFSERIKISQERLDICKICEHFDEKEIKCKECGCYMKFKTLLPWATCPLGKWNSFVNKIDLE